MICMICGFVAASLDNTTMAEHIAAEHPEQWAMAIDMACMEALADGKIGWPSDG